MAISAEVTVVISFVVFCWLYAKKIYPLVTRGLDGHIDEIRNRIDEAERLKKQALEDLRQAYIRKDESEKFVIRSRHENEEKIRKLYADNEVILQELAKKQEAALNARLNAEFMKQKEGLFERVADLICDEVKDRIRSRGAPTVAFSKEDLKRLV